MSFFFSPFRNITLFHVLAALLFISACQTTPPTREEAAYQFIRRELLHFNGGIGTYPSNASTDHNELGIKPQDVLAETMGLAMLYYVETGRKKDFDRTWRFVLENMLSKHGLVSWKLDGKNSVPLPSSAAIDDLRIARTLLQAYNLWGDEHYLKAGLIIGKAIRRYELFHGLPVEFFAWGGGESKSKEIDLSYLDLYAMKLLASHDPAWVEIHRKSRDLILRSLTEHGLFYDKYSPEKDKFYNRDNNLINKLLCAIHLAETGVNESGVIIFIERQILDTGILKGRYDAESGRATVNYDSVAVYALALNFAILYDREGLIDLLLERLKMFQNGYQSKKLRGCFGKGNCHSFDNLQVIIALHRMPEEWPIP